MSLSSSCMLIMSLMMVRIIGATHSPSPASQNTSSPSLASQNSTTNSSIHCKIGEGPRYHKVTHGICSNRIQSWEECRAAFNFLQSKNSISADTYNNSISANTYNNSIPANATEGSRRRLGHDRPAGCYAWQGNGWPDFNYYDSQADCGADTRTYCICRSTECMKCTGGIGLGGDKPCQPCPKGHYCPNPAMPPIPCPIGTFNNDKGFGTSCKKCPVYATNNKTGESVCNICMPGYGYAAYSGTCYPCGADTFSKGGINATCQKCEVGKISSHAAAECIDINALLNKVARLESMLSNPKYLCESASDFCGPGTKWMNGNCVSTFDGILEACKKARPGWEWTCESQSCHADAELNL